MLVLSMFFLFSSEAFSQYTMRASNLPSPYPSLQTKQNALASTVAYIAVMQAPYQASQTYDGINDPDKILVKAKILESVHASLSQGAEVTDALNNAYMTLENLQLNEGDRFTALYSRLWSQAFTEIVNVVKK